MIYLETHSTDCSYNLAFEEWVLTNCTGGEYLILWQNDRTVVIGQNQNTPEEINAGFVRDHRIRVVRRTTGGGAVYHDLGNLNYSFITDYDKKAGTDMSRFTDLVVEALRRLGLDASASGRNDILVSGKKVSGTAQRVVKVKDGEAVKERILYHGTLLFRSDPGMIAGALHADPLKFTGKSTKSVRSRVGNISDFLPSEMTLSDFWSTLKNLLSGESGEKVTVDEEAVLRLKREKYDTWEWNYGKSPAAGFSNKRKFDGGILEVRMEVKKGIITDMVLYGDFLSLKPAEELAERLKGICCRKEDIDKALEGVTVSDYLGAIRKEELTDTILGINET